MVLATAGVRRVEGATTTRGRNVGQAERLLSLAAGGLLVVQGYRRRGLAGMLLGAAGGELLRRGATGRCHLYDALGVTTAEGDTMLPHRDVTSRAATVNARRAVKVERTVHVRRTPAELYALWRDFDALPRWFDRLRSVTTKDGVHTTWVASLEGGRTIEWKAELVNDVPNELIAWKTVGTPDIAHAGSVHFRRDGDGTELRFVIDFEPGGAGALGHPGAVVGQAGDLVERELAHFRDRVEAADASTR